MENKFVDFNWFKKINIVDLAVNKYGFTINRSKSTSNAIQIENGGERIIVRQNKTTGEYYYNNPNNVSDKGDSIAFICHRENLSIKGNTGKLMDLLRSDIGSIPTMIPEKPLEIFNTSKLYPCNNFSYLHNRNITKKTYNSNVFLGSIKSYLVQTELSQFYNLAFPMSDYNNNVVGADLRNINFKGMAQNSIKDKSLWVANIDKGVEDVNNVVIAESPVDLLSHYQLDQNMINKENNVYLSTGGAITASQQLLIQKVVNKLGNPKVLCATDNDLQGWVYACNIANSLRSDAITVNEHQFVVMEDKRTDNFIVNIKGKADYIKNLLVLNNVKFLAKESQNAVVDLCIEFKRDIENLRGLFKVIVYSNNLSEKVERSVPLVGKDWNEALSIEVNKSKKVTHFFDNKIESKSKGFEL